MQPWKRACAFHQQETITNYCRSRQCFLPLCPKCIHEHVEEHNRLEQFPEIEAIDVIFHQSAQSLELVQQLTARMSQQLQNIQLEKEKVCQSLRMRFMQARRRIVHEIQRGLDQAERRINTHIMQFTRNVGWTLTGIEERLNKVMERVLVGLDGLNGQNSLCTLILLHSSNSPEALSEQLQKIQISIDETKEGKLELRVQEEAVRRIREDLGDYFQIRIEHDWNIE